MRRAVIPAPHRVSTVDVDPPPLAAGEVRLAIRACGICGSDLHTYEGRHPFVRYPVYPGHELGGVVVEAGPGVPPEWVGRAVAVEPSLTCGTCENCRAGRYNICDTLRVMGFQAPGGMAETFAVPLDRLVELPPPLTAEQGAGLEPLAVCVHAARLPSSLAGRDVLVLGAGPIGLLTGQVARVYGARRVAVVDVLEARLSLAARLGLDSLRGDDARVDQRIRETFGGRAPDVAFECVGLEATLRQAIASVRKGGEVVVVGVFGQDVLVPAALVQDRELHLRGSLMYTRGDFQEAARLLADGKVQEDLLVTHRVGLEDVHHAFELARRRAEALKVLVVPEG
jgi:L-iditol 2-dehydrogenase